MPIKDLDSEQIDMAERAIEYRRSWNMSDCGVGKTIGAVHAVHLGRTEHGIKGRVLVLCPKTSMQTAWGDDIDDYNAYAGTNYTYALAYAGKSRLEAFESDADYVIMNHDGVKWLDENVHLINDGSFDWVFYDEVTAYKTPTSQRTKAALGTRIFFPYRQSISATPFAKSVADGFIPTLLVDDGEHLGQSYYKFRSQVCQAERVGQDPRAIRWTDKPEAKEQIVDALVDMTIRHELVINARTRELEYRVDIPSKVRAAYEFMKEHGIYEGEDGQTAIAVNAAVKLNKMLQILTGSIYDNQGNTILIHTERYEFVIDKVEERAHPSLVMYNWRHELDQMLTHAKKRKLPIAFINSGVPPTKRTEIVRDFQNGKYHAVFAHPKTVAHSLTFTRGDAVIWPSPPNSPELLIQGNRRVSRRGQEKDNQIIYIGARDTKELEVYERLQNPLATQADILAVFAASTRGQ